jgi:hypothetical protein
LRRGLAETVNVDTLLPPEGSEDRSYLQAELADLVKYHRKKRLRQYQNACRRIAGDVEADE